MIETYLIEAESIEIAELQYTEDYLDEAEFESVKFTEVKENEKMHEITINIEYFTELVKKAHAFEILKAKEAESSYHSDFEMAIFGFEKPEAGTRVPKAEEDDF